MAEPSLFRDAETDWQPLASAFVTWARLSAAVPLVLAFVCTLVGLGMASTVWRAVLLAAAVVLGAVVVWMAVWWAPRWSASWGYAERDHDLVITRGRMFKKLTVVPYGRMQVVEVATDPVMSSLGMARVKLVTASAQTDASLPGLVTAEAHALRDRLAARGEHQAAGL